MGTGEIPLEARLLWGENLRRERLRSGVTTYQLARLLGVSRQSISSWENGHSAPSYAKRRKIAAHFGAPGESSSSTRRRMFRLFPDWIDEEASA